MIDRNLIKRRLAALMLGAAVFVAATGLIEAAEVVTHFTPKDRGSRAGSEDERGGAGVSWAPDARSSGRALEPETRRQLARGWRSAWEVLERASLERSPSMLEDGFGGTALEQAGSAVEAGAVPRSVRGHRLRLEFYSADGQVVSLSDLGPRAAGQRDSASPEGATWDAVLVLSDGRWRVHQLVRRGALLGKR